MEDSPPTYEVTMTALIYGGEALGRLPDGKAVFVPYLLPGERARVQIVEEKRGYARAELLDLLEASPDRINPLCAHFFICGGCHYQHMPYERQLEAKAAILKDQLERIGRLDDPPVQPAVPSPEPYYYRNHVQFHLTPEGQLGYHHARSGQVFAISECHLPEPPLNALWPQLDIEPISGLDCVRLRLGDEGDILLALESEEPALPEFSVEDLPISVVHLSPAGAQVLAGSDTIFITVLGRTFRISAESFFQVNTPMATAMVEHVLDRLELDRLMTLLDVYAGVGLFSAFLAEEVGELVAIESSPAASEDFAANLAEFDNVSLYEAPAEEVLPVLAAQPQVILVDPPRAGLDRQALDAIVDMSPPTLVYVSCDPATLARDARRLAAGGYRLDQITPFDLFPQTYHIESISFWRK
jgi:23S rRNA (uracil1939-C5)-methyltransferase